jgi:hypothetical protein
MRWIVAWGILAAAILAVISFGGHFALGQIASLLIFVAAAATLVLVRPVMKRFPPERRITFNHSRTTPIQKYLLPVGAVSIVAAFAWVMTLARSVPNSQTGVVILFFPSIALLAVGVAAIAFRVYIWFFGD